MIRQPGIGSCDSIARQTYDPTVTLHLIEGILFKFRQSRQGKS